MRKGVFAETESNYAYQHGNNFIPVQNADFVNFSPDKYQDKENVPWLLLDFMQEVPKEFLDTIESNKKIKEFIGQRSNHKRII